MVYHKGVGDEGDVPFFFGDWLLQGATDDPRAFESPPKQMWETTADPGSSKSSSELERNFDDDIMLKVEDYAETDMAEIIIQPQGTRGDLPPVVHPACTMSSASAGASNNGPQALSNGSHYVGKDWVSQVAI